MRSWGVTLVLLAAGSFLLNMLGMEFILLSWVDLWGTGIGMFIRFGLIGLGCVMAIFGSPGAE